MSTKVDKWRIICFVILLISGITMLVCMGDNSLTYFDSFAVDSFGRVYIGQGAYDIYVYQEGQMLYEFTALPGLENISIKGIFFTIKEDQLLLSTQGNLYTVDLQGNVLSRKQYSKGSLDSEFCFTAANGDVYTKEHIWGRTAIVKNGTETVFQIPARGVAKKIILALSILLLFPSAIVFAALTISSRPSTRYYYHK